MATEGAVRSLDTGSIVALLDDLPVTLGVVYGSHARGEATPGSDVDLAVAFRTAIPDLERTHARLALIDRLSVHLGHDVDVVPLSAVSAALQRAIREEGIVIYGDPDDFDAYCADEGATSTRDERLARFDEMLDALEQVV